MIEIPFVKMHGLGNDVLILDSLDEGDTGQRLSVTSVFAKRICDRRYGIGADQLLWLRKPQDSALDVRMEILNADGSSAEMCGNGIRAVALYLHKKAENLHVTDGIPSVPKTPLKVETLAGIMEVCITRDGQVEVDMGVPKLGGGFSLADSEVSQGEQITISQTTHSSSSNPTLSFFEVSMGNPHAVFFVNSLAAVSGMPGVNAGALEQGTFQTEDALALLGPRIERHSRFPHRTNVEFVEVVNTKHIKIRVWERGAGLTLACGTGACAAAVASIATGKTEQSIKVSLPGGDLQVRWKPGQNSVYMTGPATEICRGIYFWEE